MGLKYVNNDACYPSLIVIGQIMDALLSGKYDLDHTAVLMSQTGGGCRASNYIGFIRRALEKAGHAADSGYLRQCQRHGDEPRLHDSPLPLLTKAMQAIVYGDVFMRVLYATRPYEAGAGHCRCPSREMEGASALQSLSKTASDHDGIRTQYPRNHPGFRQSADRLDVKKPKVGIVGEILVKFSPLANNHMVELLEAEGAEAVMPDLMDFLLYCFYNSNFKAEHLGTKKSTAYSVQRGHRPAGVFPQDCHERA